MRAALAESEDRYRQLFENAPVGIGVHAKDRALFVNPAGARMLGYDDPSELVGVPIAEILHPEDRADALARVRRMLAGEPDVYPVVQRFVRRGGEAFRVQVTGSPITFEGKPAIQVIFLDLSQREAAERAAEEARFHLQTLLDSVTDVVWAVDLRSDEYVYISPSVERLYGWRPETFLKKPHLWLETVHPEDRAQVARHNEILADAGTVEARYRVVRPDGAVRWVHDRKRVLRREGGVPTHIGGIARDITEEHVLNQALAAQSRQMQTLLDNLPGMAYRCENNPRWTMRFVSGGARALTGYGPEHLVDDAVVAYGDLILPEDRERVWQAVQAAVRRREPYVLEYRIRRRDGAARWVWERGVAVYGEAEDGPVLEGFITDITERREAKDRLLQAQRMESLGRLAGGVAHDFNNLLTVIQTSVEFCLEELGDPAALRQDLTAIREAAARGAGITAQLLTFSRRHPRRVEEVDVHAVLEDLGRMLRRSLGEDVALEIRRGAHRAHVRADATQLTQVFLNLAVNARDAMPRGGRLLIETRNAPARGTAGDGGAETPEPAAPEWLVVRVADTGCGMDEQTRRFAFDPFFSTKERGQGTGLGLAMVHGIVTQCGGEVTLESAPGAGTTVILRFPVVSASAPEAAETARTGLTPGSGVVLLVEDEDAVRRFARRSLVRAGYEVIDACDGPSALQAVQEGAAIDLLLTDVVMPGMSGVALAEAVRGERPGLPVLFMSGYAGDRLAEVSEGAVPEPLLHKPFTPAELAARVASVLAAARKG